MQQLFLGIDPENLARVPFAPVLTHAETYPAKNYIPLLPNASVQIIPDISGYVGADTVACILATGQHLQNEITLLVDIGTNGEMVLGSKDRLLHSCRPCSGRCQYPLRNAWTNRRHRPCLAGKRPIPL